MNRKRIELRFNGRRKHKGRAGSRRARSSADGGKSARKKVERKKETGTPSGEAAAEVEVEVEAGRRKMDGVGMSNKRISTRPMWREGGLRRVGLAASVVATSGAAYASFRQLPPPLVIRATASCFLLSAPLFALREVVAASFSVEGPVASAIVGGFAGYVGALAFTSGTWRAVSHGAMAVGLGAGLMDTLLTSIDYRRKALLLRWQDAALERTTKSNNGNSGRTVAALTDKNNQNQLKADGGEDGHGLTNQVSGTESSTISLSSNGASSGDWPVWLPVVKQSEDEEYLNLIQSHKATAAALEQEQARIAQLLETIEKLKSGHTTDAETNIVSMTSEPRRPPLAAKCP